MTVAASQKRHGKWKILLEVKNCKQLENFGALRNLLEKYMESSKCSFGLSKEHLLTNLIGNYKIWKKINNRDTVLPINFKIRTLILVEACRTTNRLSFIFHQIQIKYVSNIEEEFSSFEMERSPEKIHLIELKKTTTTRGIDLNPSSHFYVSRVNHSST